jgi:ABC-type multidrug transport system ATPase subunit
VSGTILAAKTPKTGFSRSQIREDRLWMGRSGIKSPDVERLAPLISIRRPASCPTAPRTIVANFVLRAKCHCRGGVYRHGISAPIGRITIDVAMIEWGNSWRRFTFCALIPRFYEATSGSVLIDGMDIRDLTLSSLRRNVGVVQQDVYLFSGTVAENLRYGRPEASDEEIVAAARAANAHEFISALPSGYDTDIGQRGVTLSGGQKQRLTIARAFLKNPAILIFDEATSVLDNESERAVQQALLELTKGRTTIVIAHRLSTVRNADRILVLTEGGIGGQGSHDALMADDGLYASLHRGGCEHLGNQLIPGPVLPEGDRLGILTSRKSRITVAETAGTQHLTDRFWRITDAMAADAQRS